MNQYIITEEIVCSGCDMCNKDAVSKNECSILFNVRSHPYQSERDKVLDELENDIPVYLSENPEGTIRDFIDFLIMEFKELRQKAGDR
jgi:hypothetical protein